MFTKLTEQVEKLALRTDPGLAIKLLGKVPESVLLQIQRSRFRHTVRAASHAPFYAEQFARRKIDIDKVRVPSDLAGFFTTGADLQYHGPEMFMIGRPDTAFETTGTTSAEPKRVYFSNRELNEMGRASAIGLYQLGLRREDVVLSAFDVSFWVSPAVVRTAFQYLGCFHTEAGKIPPSEFYERAKNYEPTVIFGEPSWMVRLSEIAASRGTWKVKFLFAGGENINESTRAEVEKIWNAPLYLNYGQTESFGAIGVECREKNGYHRNDLNFLFEIANADAFGTGELVYTTLTREVMPLIRYRSTDVTRMIEFPCKCGLFAKRIAKIEGRCDEMIVCGMGNISPWVFAEILRDVPLATDEWQVRVFHENKNDIVELHVEAEQADEAPVRTAMERAISSNLHLRFPDMARNLEMGLYELRLVLVDRGTLRRSRKLRRLVYSPEPPTTDSNDNRTLKILPSSLGREIIGILSRLCLRCISSRLF